MVRIQRKSIDKGGIKGILKKQISDSFPKDGGVFAVEHGYLQKENIRRLMPEYLTDVISVKDYGDNDRVTCGRFEPKKK